MATEGKPQATDIVIGAGSGIGGALVDRWRHDGVRPVLAVARTGSLSRWLSLNDLSTHPCDYTDEALQTLADRLTTENCDIARLVICNGVLQGEDYRPERALSHLDSSAMERVFAVNTFLPMRVLSALSPVLKALASGAPVTELTWAAVTLSTIEAKTWTVSVSWGLHASVNRFGARL